MEELSSAWKSSEERAEKLEKLAPTMEQLGRAWKKVERRGRSRDRDEKDKAEKRRSEARSDAKKSVKASPNKQDGFSSFFKPFAAALEASFLTPEEIARKRGLEPPAKSSSE